MSDVKHTPGPWSFVEHNWSDTSIYGDYSDTGERYIGTLSIKDEATEETQEPLESEMGANARLIAAAPELLEMVIRVRKHGGIENLKQFDELDELIAKATGEDQS